MPSHSILVRHDKITPRHIGGGGKKATHTLSPSLWRHHSHIFIHNFISASRSTYRKQTGIMDWDWFTPRALNLIQSSDTSVTSDSDLIKKKKKKVKLWDYKKKKNKIYIPVLWKVIYIKSKCGIMLGFSLFYELFRRQRLSNLYCWQNNLQIR